MPKDIKSNENEGLSKGQPFIDYLDALSQLLIFEEQQAFNMHIRSSSFLRKSPKRHFCDVSLAIAALRLDKDRLMKDLKYCGFLFESLVYHDLKMYARANEAEIFYYEDSSGLEVDAIVQKNDGTWAAFEVKLGAGMIDQAASNLQRLSQLVDGTKQNKPISLNVVSRY